jgi:hypothetical protein
MGSTHQIQDSKTKKYIIFFIFYSNFKFSPDFFEPIQPMNNKSKSPEKSVNNMEDKTNLSKRVYINIDKEDEEDRELIDLLNGKRKFLKSIN